MITALEISNWILALALLVPAAVFFTEVAVAFVSRADKREHSPSGDRADATAAAATAAAPALADAAAARVLPQGASPSVAILVPAHNEAEGLLPTLLCFRAAMRTGDRLVVVADNCSDDTATIAQAAGAEVVVRHNLVKRGKIHAVEAGVSYLRARPPEQLLILDADCAIPADFVSALSRACADHGTPVQSLYLMRGPSDDTRAATRFAEFAWRIKNWVRPLGGRRLGVPCMLNGSGMIFPWSQISSVAIANGNLAEDYTLGIELVRHGYCPRFSAAATVTSTFPNSLVSRSGQRTRWEHGHIDLTTRTAPRLIGAALYHGNWPLLGTGIDLLVPPLALLAVLSVASLLWTALSTLLGVGPLPLELCLTGCTLLLSSLLLAWLGWGGDIVPPAVLLQIPAYAWSKAGLYQRYLTAREHQWKRTGRD